MLERTWFVTGVSSGFGRELTEQLLARGNRVVGTVRDSGKVADLVERYPEAFRVEVLDVTDTAALRKVVERSFAELGRIEVIVSNAGYGLFGAAEELSDEQINRIIATNLVAPIQLIRAVLPHLRAQGAGRIIQISSYGGQVAFRHPAVHAHMAATVDLISNGRLDFGIGAGWNEYEHQSMGIPLYTPGERIRRLGEACEVIQRLFTQHLTDFEGRYYQLKQARCEPKPVQKPYPPFVIGGSGEQLTLRIVARYADVWNYMSTNVEEFRHKVRVLHEHCAAVGRDPTKVELSVQTRVNYDDLSATVATLQPLVEAGATHLVLMLNYPYPTGSSPGWPTRWLGGSVNKGTKE